MIDSLLVLVTTATLTLILFMFLVRRRQKRTGDRQIEARIFFQEQDGSEIFAPPEYPGKYFAIANPNDRRQIISYYTWSASLDHSLGIIVGIFAGHLGLNWLDDLHWIIKWWVVLVAAISIVRPINWLWFKIKRRWLEHLVAKLSLRADFSHRPDRHNHPFSDPLQTDL